MRQRLPYRVCSILTACTAGFALAAAGCGAASSDACSDVASVSEAITAGSAVPRHLALSDAQADAVVQVLVFPVDDTIPPRPCSGTLISSTQVLSAAHCASAWPVTRIEVRFGADADHPRAVVLAHGRNAHPSLDALLIEISDTASDLANPIAPGLDATPVRDQRVELAGYGFTDDGLERQRRFVEEDVSELTTDTITVDGGGKTGACGGDSGGPLLVSDSAGQPRLVGVLSSGSPDCRGADHYVAVHAIAAWLRDFGVEDSTPVTCQSRAGSRIDTND